MSEIGKQTPKLFDDIGKINQFSLPKNGFIETVK